MPPDATLAHEAPGDEAGIVAAVADAAAARRTLSIEGRGTKAPMLRPVQAEATLSTRNLQGIVLHAPAELIVTARAGTTLTELDATLAGGNQHVVSEPPDLSALLGTAGPQTLGGVVATNLSGPRRVMAGATRDHVMGIRFVNGSGEALRSGGRVLKNVTGLDLCKLLAGSHGTLGVITEVTLKVLPVPERTGSLVLEGLDPAAGVAALSAALGSPFGVSGAAYLPAGQAARVPCLGARGAAAVIRIEEFAESVDYRLGRLATLLESYGAPARLDHDASRAAWAAIRDAAPLDPAPDHAVWRVSVRPSHGPSVLEAVEAAGGAAFLDWGGGLAWISGPAALHDAVIQAATRARGSWTVLRGPPSMRAAVAVVPPEPPPLAAIARRVKAAMDPLALFNPGRMAAGS